MYAYNELLFPAGIIPLLRSTRGDKWKALVDRVAGLPEDHPEALAFSLMMIRLDGCMACETDSYRAMRGCAPCARQTLRRFKGTDNDLIRRYQDSLREIQAYLANCPDQIPQALPVPAKAA